MEWYVIDTSYHVGSRPVSACPSSNVSRPSCTAHVLLCPSLTYCKATIDGCVSSTQAASSRTLSRRAQGLVPVFRAIAGNEPATWFAGNVTVFLSHICSLLFLASSRNSAADGM
ncbi:hypothetical protein ES702_03138 [subsurface metagenome]